MHHSCSTGRKTKMAVSKVGGDIAFVLFCLAAASIGLTNGLHCFVSNASTLESKICYSTFNDSESYVEENSTNTTTSTALSSNISISSKISIEYPATPSQRPQLFLQHCLIFQYRTNSSVLTVHTKLYSHFSCDFTKVCNRTGQWRYDNVNYEGKVGTLICCDTDNCNRKELINLKQRCYTGKKTGSVIKGGKLETCSEGETFCVRNITYRGQEEVSEWHSCMSAEYCVKKHNLTAPNSACKNVSISKSRSAEICCCQKPCCYIPSWIKPTSVSVTKSTVAMIQSPSHSYQWIVVGSLVSVFAVMFVIIFVIVVLSIKRQLKKQNNNHVSLAYKRIAADSAEEADVQMLLG